MLALLLNVLIQTTITAIVVLKMATYTKLDADTASDLRYYRALPSGTTQYPSSAGTTALLPWLLTIARSVREHARPRVTLCGCKAATFVRHAHLCVQAVAPDHRAPAQSGRRSHGRAASGCATCNM
jgi:hypothetical protein